MSNKFRLLILMKLFAIIPAILHVQQNERRFYDKLDGLWTFVLEESNSIGIGINKKWHLLDLLKFPNATMMPVPAAYNDLTAVREVRDHTGWVWYQTKFFSSARDRPFRHHVRFSSVNYFALVFLNDKLAGTHVGGHLPFEFDISRNILFDQENRLTVAVNNTMSSHTIPPGEFLYIQKSRAGQKQYRDGFFKQIWNFDFFNYAGILRSVYITKKSFAYIDDIAIEAYHNGSFAYKIYLASANTIATVLVNILDQHGVLVFQSNSQQFRGRINNVDPWWPRDMGKPVLYQFVVRLLISRILVDIYRLRFGFRTVMHTSDQILINDKAFYCHGFGMHEDFELHGRGFNQVVMTKDLNMLEWMNGNCYRTSHYPYSEERALEADRRGIAVITETPGVALSYFTRDNQLLHAEMIKELVERDRNHPSTIMWSLANEPQSNLPDARPYFDGLVNFTRALDKTRPVTIVLSASFDSDKVADLLDVLCVNRYFGWYIDTGYLDTVNASWVFEITNWKQKFNKPVIVSEYGADAIPGLDQGPGRAYSEQYQSELLVETHKAFDHLRKDHIIAGEMIWNLADFMTAQGVNRPVGNHKGVLTRSRQPKMAAYLIKKRYENLEKKTNSSSFTVTATTGTITSLKDTLFSLILPAAIAPNAGQ